MANRGGKREGSGRKASLKSEALQILRDRMTDDDFELALQTLRYAMKNRKKNLKAATSAAQFIIEHKIGKAPQPISGDKDNPVKVLFEIRDVGR